jgi:hypothetical protein
VLLLQELHRVEVHANMVVRDTAAMAAS